MNELRKEKNELRKEKNDPEMRREMDKGKANII